MTVGSAAGAAAMLDAQAPEVVAVEGTPADLEKREDIRKEWLEV